jgi:quercetin dioxygenase-like cupin family protein
MPAFDCRDLAWFSSAGRAVQRLYAAGPCEVLLVCWAAGQRSSSHDHGHSESVVVIVEGRLVAVEDGVERECGPGSVIVTPVGSTHQLRKDSAEPAMSVHVYAPPVTGEVSQPFRDLTLVPVPRVSSTLSEKLEPILRGGAHAQL